MDDFTIRPRLSTCSGLTRVTPTADMSESQGWDFRCNKGHCLNRLGSAKFNICASSQKDPAVKNIPKAVKRVHEIFEKPTFMEDVLPEDIKQGNLGDCWLIAGLTALANVPDGIKRICVEYDTSKYFPRSMLHGGSTSGANFD